MYIWVKPRPHTHSKCGLRFPPQYHISQNLNVLWVQKRNPDMLPFSLKESRQANPLQVPQRGPYGEIYLLTGRFYFSLKISLFIFPSESPVREPLQCSLTGSPRAAILRHQSHWSTFHSFIHSCMSARVPIKEPTYIHMGKNVRSPSTEPHADERPTYNEVCPGLLWSLRHCCLYPSVMQFSARYLPPWLG
jgi:hypothetical protein